MRSLHLKPRGKTRQLGGRRSDGVTVSKLIRWAPSSVLEERDSGSCCWTTPGTGAGGCGASRVTA